MPVKTAAALACFTAMIVLPVGHAGAQTLGELRRIQADTVMLKAQAANREAAGSGAEGSAGSSAGEALVPELVGVFGGQEGMYARFTVGDSAGVNVYAGKPFFGDYRVKTVTMNEVTLCRASKCWPIRLAGALTPATVAAPAATGAQVQPTQLPALPVGR